MNQHTDRIQELEEQLDVTRELVKAAFDFVESRSIEDYMGLAVAARNYRKYIGD